MTTTGAHYWRTLIGHDAWQRIVSRWGGHEYCIPTRIQSESGEALIGLAGYDAAIKLIAHASGDRIYIAAGWEEILLARYTHIVALRNAGKTNSEISRTFTYISG